MSKLLFANFSRLKKNKLFWAELIFMFALGAWLAINQYIQHIKYGYDEAALDNVFFGYTLIIGILIAVFSSLFLGTEYNDGTIRNKLIVGHSRMNIYYSNLITNISAALLVCLSFLVSVMSFGIPLIGFVTMDIKIVLLILLGTIMLTASFCSVFTLISMVCANKTIVAVINILGVFALLLLATTIDKKLNAPEYYGSYVLTDSHGNVETKMMKNDEYLTGTKRAVYEFVNDFLPTGQSIQYSNMSALHLWQMPLYSLLISIVTSVIGAAIFKRKDLK